MYTPVKPQSPAQKSLLGDYLGFLKHPEMSPLNLKTRDIISHIWRLYTGHLVLMVPMLVIIRLISPLISGIEENKISDLMETVPIYQMIFLAVVMAPLAEELIFRLPLKFRGRNFAIPLGILCFTIGGNLLPLTERPLFSLACLFGLMLVAIQGPLMLCRAITKPKGDAFFAKYLALLVFGSSIVFGAVHITNYPISAWMAAPILVLPQTTLGVLLAYVRLKFGYWWAVLTHGLHNLLITSPLMFVAFGSEQLKQKFLDQAKDVAVLPQDRVVEGLLVVWTLVMLALIVRTAVKLVLEWKQARTATAS